MTKENTGEVYQKQETSRGFVQDFEDIGKDQDGLDYLLKNMAKIGLAEVKVLIPEVRKVKPINSETQELIKKVLDGFQEKITKQEQEITKQEKLGYQKEQKAQEELATLNKELDKYDESRLQKTIADEDWASQAKASVPSKKPSQGNWLTRLLKRKK